MAGMEHIFGAVHTIHASRKTNSEHITRTEGLKIDETNHANKWAT